MRAWLDHASRFSGAVTDTVPDGRDGFVWHLSSANNRAIARSAGVHDTFEGAAGAVHRVRDGLTRIVVRIVKQSAQPLYGWSGTIDNSLVVTCARWYSTVRDARDSLADAVATLGTASVDDAPRHLSTVRDAR